MIACIRSFFIAAVLLFVCNSATEFQRIAAADQVSVALAEPTAGEEDTTAGGDDDMTGDVVPAVTAESNCSAYTSLESLAYSEHVREVVLPPPLT